MNYLISTVTSITLIKLQDLTRRQLTCVQNSPREKLNITNGQGND